MLLFNPNFIFFLHIFLPNIINLFKNTIKFILNLNYNFRNINLSGKI